MLGAVVADGSSLKLLAQALNKIVDSASKDNHHHHHHHPRPHRDGSNDNEDNNAGTASPSVCVGGDSFDELERVAAELGIITWGPSSADDPPLDQQSTAETKSLPGSEDDLESKEQTQNNDSSSPDDGEDQKLLKMGFNTALAIALHNFPEGLATFVAALSDLKVGFVLAVAIAIHNVPEGLCVALPIYYATKNGTKAFLYALLSGISEPFAALLGWIVLANVVSDTVYAALFGIVAGMMVTISVRELLPTCIRYDPDDEVMTVSFIFGMALISLSLVLFQL